MIMSRQEERAKIDRFNRDAYYQDLSAALITAGAKVILGCTIQGHYCIAQVNGEDPGMRVRNVGDHRSHLRVVYNSATWNINSWQKKSRRLRRKNGDTTVASVCADLIAFTAAAKKRRAQPADEGALQSMNINREIDEIRRAEMYRERDAMAQRIFERVCAIEIARPGSGVTPRTDRTPKHEWFAGHVHAAIAAADAFMHAKLTGKKTTNE